MSKKLILILSVSLSLTGVICAQDTDSHPLNFKKIKKEIRKKNSPYYYPDLYRRYTEMDTSLGVEDFRYLYYGFTFQDNYSPYGVPKLRDSLISYLSREELLLAEYEVAAKLGSELLRESPFRLRETFITALCFEMAGNNSMSSIYFDYYEKQVDAIMLTGDGLSTKTALKVIYVHDEYELLEVLGFKFGGKQHLLEGNYDMLELEQNPYGIDALYFDVSRLFESGND